MANSRKGSIISTNPFEHMHRLFKVIDKQRRGNPTLVSNNVNFNFQTKYWWFDSKYPESVQKQKQDKLCINAVNKTSGWSFNKTLPWSSKTIKKQKLKIKIKEINRGKKRCTVTAKTTNLTYNGAVGNPCPAKVIAPHRSWWGWGVPNVFFYKFFFLHVR